jgi:glycosyltransferase involved in cell wall biosynthesis
MKILGVIAHIGKGGGQVTQSMRILKELSRRHKVTLLTLKVDSDIVNPSCETVYAGEFQWPKGVFMLMRKIREMGGHYDVVQCFDGYYSFPAAVLARKKPYFLRMGMDAQSFLAEKGLWFSRLWGWLQMLPVALGDCARFVVNSENLRRECQKYNPAVIQNGYDLDEFRVRQSQKELRKRLGLPQGKTLLLYTGKVIPRKQVERMFELLKRDRNYHLVLLGGYAEDGGAYYRSLMSRYQRMKRQFTFCGEVNMKGVRYYLKACDIFVFPSSLEGSPNSMLEAMGAGMPVVCSDIPSHREIISHGKNGMLCSAISDYHAAIKELTAKKELYQMLSRAAREYVRKNHSIKTAAEQYIKLYRPHT